jgi:transposase-like protein
MTEEERSVVIEEYNNGSSTYALADKYSIDRVTLTTWLKRHGVVLRGRGPAKKPKPAEEDTRKPASVHDLVKTPKPKPVKEEAPEQKPEDDKPVIVTLPHPLPSLAQPVISGKSDKETLADINQALRSLTDAYAGLNSKQQIWFDVGESYGRLCCLADELERRINHEHPDDND